MDFETLPQSSEIMRTLKSYQGLLSDLSQFDTPANLICGSQERPLEQGFEKIDFYLLKTIQVLSNQIWDLSGDDYQLIEKFSNRKILTESAGFDLTLNQNLIVFPLEVEIKSDLSSSPFKLFGGALVQKTVNSYPKLNLTKICYLRGFKLFKTVHYWEEYRRSLSKQEPLKKFNLKQVF